MTERLLTPRLAVAFLTMLLVSGIGNAFPVFFPPLLAEFGGSRAATASCVTLVWLGGAALGPVARYLVARRDPRRIMVVGLGAVALGLACGSVAPTLPLFVVAVGVGAGVGVGLTGMVTQAALLADAYARHRGLALGIAFSGSMAGYALAGPAQFAIARIGWRGALACYVVAILALIPFAWHAYPRRLSAAGPAPRGARAGATTTARAIARTPAFWALFAVFAFPPMIGYLATTQHTLYLTARGFTAGEASLLLAVGGVLATGGRALAGLAADRLGAGVAGLLSFALSLAGLLCLVGLELGSWRALAYGYVTLVFLPLGSRATIVSVLAGRIAPPAQYGAILGYLSVGNNLCAAAGPLLSGALYDRTGSYLAIYLTATGLLVVCLAALGLFCALIADRPAR